MGFCLICDKLITIWEVWTGSAKRHDGIYYHVKCLQHRKKK